MDIFRLQAIGITTPDYVALASDASVMLSKLWSDPSLIDPLLEMADQLSCQSGYATDAMDIFTDVAQNSHSDRTTKQRCIDGFNKSAQSISDDGDRVEAFIKAGQNAHEGEIKWHIAAGILWGARTLSGLQKAKALLVAEKHAPKDSALERQVIENVLLAGDALALPKEAIDFFAAAAAAAAPGSLLEEKAVDAFVRHVEVLPDVRDRIRFYTVATAARRGSVMEQAAIEGILRNAVDVPNIESVRAFHFVHRHAVAQRDERLQKKTLTAFIAHIGQVIDADLMDGMKMFVFAAQTSPQNSDIKLRMVEGILRHVDDVPDIYGRIDFLITAAVNAPTGSVAERAAIARLIMNVNTISDIPERIRQLDKAIDSTYAGSLRNEAREQKKRLINDQDPSFTAELYRPASRKVIQGNFGRRGASMAKPTP